MPLLLNVVFYLLFFLFLLQWGDAYLIPFFPLFVHEQQSKRAHSLMLSFASTVNGALINLIQGFTESLPCERCAEADALKGGVNTSEVESDGVAEVDAINKGNNGSDVEAESEANDFGVGNSASDSDAEADSSSSEEDEEIEIDASTVAKEDAGPSTRASPHHSCLSSLSRLSISLSCSFRIDS